MEVRVVALRDRREAVAHMLQIGADPVGIGIMTPKALFRAVRVDGVSARAANILKQEMLARGGEAVVARESCLGGTGQTDVLLLGTLLHFRLLASKLVRQPFGLAALGREIRDALTRFERASAPQRSLRWRSWNLPLGERTLIMGIVNVTPDSFSGDGLGEDEDAAVARGLELVRQGADILDLGAESTRPGATPLSAAEEKRRLLPVLARLRPLVDVPISVDTYKAEVADEALAHGADIVNDVWAFEADPAMAEVVARHGVPVVLMHNRAAPGYRDLMGEMVAQLRRRIGQAVAAGIRRDHLLVDPGIGFGKAADDNLMVLGRLAELRSVGCPIVLGVSRKFGRGYPFTQRLPETAAAITLGIAAGADVVRVHDVAEAARVVRLADAVVRPGGRGRRWESR